jgi:hypothetical protein
MARFLKNTLLLFCAAAAFQSCNKTGDTLSKPLLVVTPTLGSSGEAGKKMDFDIETSAANSISRVTVELQPGSGANMMYQDTTINPPVPRVTYAVQYTLPDTGLKGDEFHFTFTSYDTKGNSTSTTKTLTISGSRPKVVIGGPDNVTAGQTVNFSVTFSDAGADLKSFQWNANLNGGNDNLMKDSTFTTASRNITIPFTYQVPANLTPGEYAVMKFTATNKDNVSWTETKRFTVQ